ncbi:MAG: dTDP-4-dehydrorhamnose reductase [Patescibacteria group bacterium]|jgi:dTDP-4-dehydrorhamnose reductase
MKILITGSNGMLAGALRETLKDNDLILWDRAECDITSQDTIGKVVEAQPDWIINTAAHTAVDACETDSDQAMSVNGTGVQYLAQAAQQLDIPIIHYSSDYVFDGQKKEGYLEDDMPNPISVYGRSKLLGEQLLQRYANKWYLIRTEYLYGPGGNNIVDTFLKLGRGKPELCVVADQYSKTTYTADLARATAEMIRQNQPWGRYHLANEGVCNWSEFVSKLFELAGIRIPLKSVGMSEFVRPAPRPQYSALINTKLPPLRHWTEALTEYLEFLVTRADVEARG